MQLLTGNSIEILTDLANDSDRADLLFSDPPYKLTSGGKNSNSMGGKFASDKYNNNGVLMHITPWREMPEPFLAACRPDCDAYIMGNGKNIFQAHNEFVKAGWKLHDLLHWKKESPSRAPFYMKNTEYILYLWKGRARHINNGGTTQDLIFPRPKNAIHQTQKPIELIQVMVENSTNEGELVLEPFSGSGSTLVASMRSNRRSLGIEICPEMSAKSAIWLQMEWDRYRREQDAENSPRG